MVLLADLEGPEVERYPLGPLEALRGAPGPKELALRLGVVPRTVFRWKHERIDWLTADRLAVQAGFHPVSVWPEWGRHLAHCPEVSYEFL